MTMKEAYSKLHSNDGQFDDPNLDKTTTSFKDRKPHLGYLLIFLGGLFFGVVVAIISLNVSSSMFAGAVRGKKESGKLDVTHCGTTSQQAEAAGCHFDIMASSWYSDSCFNRDVLNQMLDEVSFDWVCVMIPVLLLRDKLPTNLETVRCCTFPLSVANLTTNDAYAELRSCACFLASGRAV